MLKTWIIIIMSLYFIPYEVNGAEYNIALNQNVTTSSAVYGYPVYLATDLELSYHVEVNYKYDVPAWILFDLKVYVYNITKIIIWPTNDDDFELAKVAVYQTYTSIIEDPEINRICTYNYPAKGIPFNCVQKKDTTKKLIGYVHLKKESTFSYDNLKIAEIAIITTQTDSYIKNWKSVEQSNGITGGSKGSLNAIDGDVKTCIYTDQTLISNQYKRGWWHADLGKAYDVLGFVISDYYTTNQSYRGNYKLYVDAYGFTKSSLCAYDTQALALLPNFVPCRYSSIGRYITVEREAAFFDRQDIMSFCYIHLVVDATETIYKYPKDYPSTTKTPAYITGSSSSGLPMYAIYVIIAGASYLGVCTTIFVIWALVNRKRFRKPNPNASNANQAQGNNRQMNAMERTNNAYTGME